MKERVLVSLFISLERELEKDRFSPKRITALIHAIETVAKLDIGMFRKPRKEKEATS